MVGRVEFLHEAEGGVEGEDGGAEVDGGWWGGEGGERRECRSWEREVVEEGVGIGWVIR